ncbi:Mitochondrial acidic protein mam33 [Teratosphaeriaceae sp. CCFEE 6253]|nr:Mitochondrial acidic protein mam33 [Teratosphaeriaceae sp. CCFEE 6253]
MLCLRTFARAAPRATARIASYSTRTPFRPSIHTPTSALRSSSRLVSAPRLFSTTHFLRDDAAQELAAKLTQEIQLESEETSSPADSNINIKDFLAQNDHWTLVDEDSNQEVLLTRQYEDETITVAFSIVDFNTPMMEQGEEGEEMDDDAMLDEEDLAAEQAQSGGANSKGSVSQGRTSGGNVKVGHEGSVAPGGRDELRSDEDEGQQEEEAQPAFPANVNVLMQRKNKGALRISLIADTGVFTIQSVTHLPDTLLGDASAGSHNKTASELLRAETPSLYTGPPFQQLDEEVQNLLEQYLDVRGINTTLALFVPEYIDVKEQKEYLGWLGRVRGFVE